MNESAIRAMLEAVPFEPFEIRMSYGDVHKIKHPENVLLVKGRLVHGDPKSGQIDILSLLHVNGLAHAAAKSKSKERNESWPPKPSVISRRSSRSSHS